MNGVCSLMVYGILVHISHTNVDAILLGVGHNQMRGVADSDDMGIGRKKRYSHSHNEGRAESFCMWAVGTSFCTWKKCFRNLQWINRETHFKKPG